MSIKHKHLIIVAAGNSTRFGGQPKCLQEVRPGVTNIENTIEKFEKYFSHISIICSNKDRMDSRWPDNSYRRFKHFIEPGGGDGLALSHYLKTHTNHADEVCIVWGDAVFEDGRIIEEIIYKISELDSVDENWDCIVPANMKSDPYVRFIVGNNYELPSDLKLVRGVQFSKYNEVTEETGYHDQCIFYFKTKTLQKIINETLDVVLVNGKVIMRNGEYTILDSLHKMKTFLYQTNYLTLSYNTPEELDEIFARFNRTT